MTVEITIHEQGCDPKRITVGRIPCSYEVIVLAGMEYSVTSVRHIADTQPPLTEVRVTRFHREETPA